MNEYSKFKVFLSALEQGLELEIGGQTYAMGFDSQERPRIAHKVQSTNSEGETKDVYMQGLLLPEINDFIISIMKSISDDDVVEIGANVTLNKIKKEKS